MSKTKPTQYFIHLLLFVITLVTTTLAGAEWTAGDQTVDTRGNVLWEAYIQKGLLFAVPFLAILTVHEFGHYLTARWYRISVTLPYYLPLWLGWLGGIPSIGTLGAFIRIKEPLHTRRQFFDVGLAGPLAGFVLALGVIWYGFTHLPPREYIYTIHADYARFGDDYEQHVYTHAYARQQDSLRYVRYAQTNKLPVDGKKIQSMLLDEYPELALGTNLLYQFFTHYVAEDPQLVPNPREMMHYPFLFAGYLALFFTALNLIPIGQLDGGHILYGMIGYRAHGIVASVLFVAFIFYAGIGIAKVNVRGEFIMMGSETPVYLGIPLYVGFLYLLFQRMIDKPADTLLLSVAVFAGQYVLASLWSIEGYHGWLVFGFILGRFLGVQHPPALYEAPLSPGRQVLGWVALLIFILSFTPQPFIVA